MTWNYLGFKSLHFVCVIFLFHELKRVKFITCTADIWFTKYDQNERVIDNDWKGVKFKKLRHAKANKNYLHLLEMVWEVLNIILKRYKKNDQSTI